MKPIRDKSAKEIKADQTLRRVVDGKATYKGHIYKVKQYDFKTNTEGTDLVADGGFIKELLDHDRAKEFEIVDES